MINQKKILFTGGTGLLGSELKKHLPEALFPSREEMDIRNTDQIFSYLNRTNPYLFVHAAALTSPPRVDKNPIEAIDSNIIGTSNIVKCCLERNLRLIYISTDYVFKGDKGNYSEEDPVLPINKYAWSKLGGEAAVRMYDNSLIIRTSFGENVFPYEKAFIDQYTSRMSVSNFVKNLISLLDTKITGIIHIGSNRRTVMDYARSLDPKKEFLPLSIKEVNFNAPEDTSLDCSKFKKILGEKK